ncbi:MAG: HAMP domain-containing sensor histidine kinase [Planctomycetota bacterium]|nr:HAMP domain-containing sensor histidine kinase [Planctomycetota bacterium]
MAAPAPSSMPPDLKSIEDVLAHFEQLEEKLRQVREGLTHSHRLVTLGTIASVIAHEYNNILTPVISYAQLALARPDDPAQMRKALERTLAGAERAARISGSLLGFARDSEAGTSATLRTAIDDALTCLAREPKKDGIRLQVDVPEVDLAIAPVNLQQILLNLVLNARQAMRRRGGDLRITAHVDGPLCRIEVADSGPGIPPEILDRLFQPFVTLRPDPSPGDSPGTGLGLCICRDLARSAGGDITVDSPPGRGATFHIAIPVAAKLPEST